MRRVPLLAVVVLALVAGLTAPAAGQEVDRAPTLTVTPSSDLVDGQAVIVEGDGWWPESRPILEECEVGTGRCALQWVRVDVDASGHFAVERIARAAFTSDDNGGEVDCLVSTCAFHIDFIAVVDAPIAFDPDAPLLPPPTITVTPDHDLVDGDVMVVEGTGFSEGDGVDYAECAPGATSVYDDECHPLDNGSALAQSWNGSPGAQPPAGEYAMRHVGADGAFHDRLWAYAKPYTGPPRRDCRVEPCELVAGVRGYVVARTPLSFDPDAPLRGPPSIRADPTGGLAHHQVVTVRGAGFYGREPLVLTQCVVGLSSCYSWNFEHPDADAAGGFVATIRVNRTVRLPSGDRADCRVVRCVVRISRYYFARRPVSLEVPIRFAP